MENISNYSWPYHFMTKTDQTILTNVDKPNQFKLVQTDQFWQKTDLILTKIDLILTIDGSGQVVRISGGQKILILQNQYKNSCSFGAPGHLRSVASEYSTQKFYFPKKTNPLEDFGKELRLKWCISGCTFFFNI